MNRFLITIAFLVVQLTSAKNTSAQTSNIWTLEDCINYAVENNITIKNASLNQTQADVDYFKVKSSRLPNLFGSASQAFSNGNSIDPITSNFVTEQINSTNVNLNSSLTLFQGNQINNQVKQNELLLRQSQFLQEEVKNNIKVSILENYLQILFAKEGITIAQNNLKASEKELERAKARLDAESISLSDYTEAQSQAATNKYAVIAAKNNYQQYVIALKQLLELSPLQEIEIKDLDEGVESINVELNKIEIYDQVLGILPEVIASEIEVEVNQKSLDIAKGGYLPTLTLSSSLGSGYTSINDNDFSDQFNVNFNQRIGLTLNVPIFNRNQTKAAVQTSTINIERAVIQKQTVEKEVYKKVETAYQNAVSAQEQLIASEASKNAAEQSYKLAQKKYELGGLSTTDLVISQNTFTNAQQNYLQAKYMSVLYHQLLQFYQGNDIKL